MQSCSVEKHLCKSRRLSIFGIIFSRICFSFFFLKNNQITLSLIRYLFLLIFKVSKWLTYSPLVNQAKTLTHLVFSGNFLAIVVRGFLVYLCLCVFVEEY